MMPPGYQPKRRLETSRTEAHGRTKIWSSRDVFATSVEHPVNPPPASWLQLRSTLVLHREQEGLCSPLIAGAVLLRWMNRTAAITSLILLGRGVSPLTRFAVKRREPLPSSSHFTNKERIKLAPFVRFLLRRLRDGCRLCHVFLCWQLCTLLNLSQLQTNLGLMAVPITAVVDFMCPCMRQKSRIHDG